MADFSWFNIRGKRKVYENAKIWVGQALKTGSPPPPPRYLSSNIIAIWKHEIVSWSVSLHIKTIAVFLSSQYIIFFIVKMFIEHLDMLVRYSWTIIQDSWRRTCSHYSTMMIPDLFTIRMRRSISTFLRAHATKLLNILPFLFEGWKQWLFRHD